MGHTDGQKQTFAKALRWRITHCSIEHTITQAHMQKCHAEFVDCYLG